MKLEAFNQAGVRQALETTLGRRDGTSGDEPPVNLGAQHIPEVGDQGEDRDVELVRVEAVGRARSRRPMDSLGAVELDELAVAVGGDPRQLP